MANHYETSPPLFRNAPLKFILYLLLIPVFGLGLFLLLWWYIDNKNKLLSIEGDLMKWQDKKLITVESAREKARQTESIN